MALSLNFAVKEQCDQKSFYLYDTTGSYSVTNTGGYGGPTNITVGDVDDVYLYVKKPGETTWTTIVLPLGLPLPSSDPSQFYEITAVMLGYGTSPDTKLPDGYYEFWYQIQGMDGPTPFEYNKICTILFSGQVECCVKKSVSKLRVNEPIDKLDNKKIREIYWKYKAMKSADCCGNKDLANSILGYLTTVCDCNCNCNC